ncbi:hypothetical protein TNCV_3149391 [Trichonephila clavipes]|nr:hypothetical protein TNCV_3149391 [Trichonephila clavipes]
MVANSASTTHMKSEFPTWRVINRVGDCCDNTHPMENTTKTFPINPNTSDANAYGIRINHTRHLNKKLPTVSKTHQTTLTPPGNERLVL